MRDFPFVLQLAVAGGGVLLSVLACLALQWRERRELGRASIAARKLAKDLAELERTKCGRTSS